MARLGLSSIGIKIGFQIETDKGVKPTTFKWFENCSAAGGSTNDRDQIDVTPMDETSYRRYRAGLGDSGGTKSLTFFLDNEGGIIDDWKELQQLAKTAAADGKACWMEKWYPDMPYAYFCTIEPGELPDPDLSVASAVEMEINNVVNEDKGWLDAVEPTAVKLTGSTRA